jgi:hypothetical protein
MNTGNTATYLLDDLTFIVKDGIDLKSSIDPTTASFVTTTTSALYADIPVTMTLWGNTLDDITNEGTSLPSGAYTVSGNEVTLKKEYLADLLTAPATLKDVTLTFEFDKGGNSDIEITIANIDANLPVTSYDFSTEPNISTLTTNNNNEVGKVRFSPTYPTGTSGITWIQPTTPGGNDGALNVAVGQGYSGGNMLIIPFNLGGKNLGDYKSIRIYIEGVSGDIGSGKGLVVNVLRPNQTTFSSNGGGNNYQFPSQNTTINASSAGTEIKIAIPTTNDLSHLTGPIEIAFYYNTNPITYRIHSIALSKEP